ncbi:MAG TPA: hypothetical protein DDW76_27645 [Cyanobacteria bacterium UBA11369]|nr:hypothetical protein [Cyanobacteria bacterium UBA11371]HBE18957.1 hypothetical protein [Cyanobacteria bacterium UBA11367]HBE30764.1 hypothetical protein [Cyanobacteria bacterium UBA11368]HBE52442.1 hypothetical protein [Cyanobacteria bacterium UBA11369]
MQRRQKLLEELSHTEVDANQLPVISGYFRVIYGLPFQLQIGLAVFMVGRYLPLFEKREPYIRWPRIMLDDVAQWVEENGRCISSSGKFEDPFDSAFRNSFDGLVAAYYYRYNPFILTSACIYTVSSAINARRCNVWAADDPEAVEIWKKRSDNPEIYLEPERQVSNNLAAVAVTRREWQAVGEWLWQQEVWNYPDEVNIEEMEDYLNYWTSNETILIAPEWLSMLEKERQGKDQKDCQSENEPELDLNSSIFFDDTTPKYYTIAAETPNPQVEYSILEMAAIYIYYSLLSVAYSQHLSHAETAHAAHALFERGDIRVRIFADEYDLEGTPDVSLTMAGIQDYLSGRIKAFYYLTPQGRARWETLSHLPD